MAGDWLHGLRPPSHEAAGLTATRLRQATALFTLSLLACTWRLWTPHDVYPQIPFLAAFCSLPDWIEIVAGVAFVAGLAVASAPARWPRLANAGLASAVAGGVLLMLADQHRLQPWVYLSLLIAFVLLTMTAEKAVVWLRVLIIGVYLHSALSKLDHSFLHTHGPELIDAFLDLFGGSLHDVDATTKAVVAGGLPLGEMLIAAGLWTRRFRSTAIWLSVAMHGVLLIALGPGGLNHKPAVLVWNIQFIVQNLLLFGGGTSQADVSTADSMPRPTAFGRMRNRLGAVVIGASSILPLLEPFGWFDHWPAWALYVSRPERITVSVHVLSRDKLPPDVREQTDPPNQLWCRVHLDRWSLEALDAPIYPQGRYRLAVALAIAERAELGQAVRIVVESPANRWNGRRDRRENRGIQALRQEMRRFRINTHRRD